MKNMKMIGTMLLGGMLLSATPAAAEIRWPWEKPKSKTEKTEKNEPTTTTRTKTQVPVATPAVTPNGNARAEDRDMLPKLAAFYSEQLDLADKAVKSSSDAQVRTFAQKLQNDSERALGVVNERARHLGVMIKPHVRVSLAEKLRQSGRAGGLNTGKPDAPTAASAASDLEFLREVMANIQEIRPQFATYKEQNPDRQIAGELDRLFNDELVPTYDEAKTIHDRVRNQNR